MDEKNRPKLLKRIRAEIANSEAERAEYEHHLQELIRFREEQVERDQKNGLQVSVSQLSKDRMIESARKLRDLKTIDLKELQEIEQEILDGTFNT